jgi:phage-related protein (TIGR01555 family)
MASAVGWNNPLTGQGFRSHDKSRNLEFGCPIDLTAQQCWDLYQGEGIGHRALALPIQEALRKGWTATWEGEAGESATWAKGLIVGPLGERGLDTALERWLTWKDMLGGAAIVLLCADGRAPDQPLDERRPALEQLRVLARTEIEPEDSATLDPATGQRGAGQVWRVSGTGLRYHHSRVILLGRSQIPAGVSDGLGGWEPSMYVLLHEALVSCAQVDGSARGAVANFIVAVQKMRGLSEKLSQGQSQILSRLGLQELVRSMYRVTLLDADKEDFAYQTTSLAGLADLMDRFPERVAAVTGIPMTLLMGRPPAGLSTDDKAGRIFFYDSVAARLQKKAMRPALERIYSLALRSPAGPTKGREPVGLTVDFAPLYQLTELERAQLDLTLAQRDAIYIDKGVYSAKDVAQSRFSGGQGDITISAPGAT